MFVFQTWLATLDVQGVGVTDAMGVIKTDDPAKAERMRRNLFLREVTGVVEKVKEEMAAQAPPPIPKRRGRPPKVIVGARTSEVLEHEGEGE